MQGVSLVLRQGDAGLVRLLRICTQRGCSWGAGRGWCGPALTHRGPRIGVAGGDLDVPEVYAGIKHRGDKRVAEQMRVRPRPQPGGAGEAPQPTGGRMPGHPGTAAAEQDRPVVPQAGCPVDRAAGGSGTWTTLLPLPRTRRTGVRSRRDHQCSRQWLRRSASRAGRAWPPARSRKGPVIPGRR